MSILFHFFGGLCALSVTPTANRPKPDADQRFLIREPAEVYHARAKDYLSSHQLADFRKCPLLFYRKRQGLIADDDRPAYLVGRAAHTLILEGDAKFDAEYTVGGPINPKTGQPYGPTTKAFAEWARTIGKQILTDSQYELVTNMHLSVLRHEVAKTLLADGIPEGVVRARVLRRALSDPYGLV